MLQVDEKKVESDAVRRSSVGDVTHGSVTETRLAGQRAATVTFKCWAPMSAAAAAAAAAGPAPFSEGWPTLATTTTRRAGGGGGGSGDETQRTLTE